VWQLQSRQDKDALIAALRHPDPDVRGRAAVALRTLDATEAVPTLKEALRAETDEQVRRYLALALHVLDHRTDVGGIAKTQDVNRLVEVLKSRNPESVVAAAKALSALGNRLAVEPLVILFHNPSSPPAVRLAAAEALLELKSAPAVVTLLGALRRDSWEVRRNAAAVLGQIQAVWAVEPLAAALDDAHPVVRRTAAAALKRIGTAEAIAALRARLTPQGLPKTGPLLAKLAEVKDDLPSVPAEKPEESRVSDDVLPPPSETVRPLRAEPRTSESHIRATQPATPITARDSRPTPAPPAQPVSPPPVSKPPEPPAQLPPVSVPTSRVQKLIAFLKRRNGEDKKKS
jgi:hypothetical protein